MSTGHQKSFVVAALVSILVSISASAATEGAHNLILVVPEALPADGIDRSNAPALARLRSEGVTFLNTHAGFPRLAKAESFEDSSDLNAETLLAAATKHFAPPLIVDDRDGAALQQLVTTTLPQAKAANQPFFIVYQLKEPKGLESGQGRSAVRPAFKPDPHAINTAVESISSALKDLGLYDTTNMVVAAEHSFSRVLKTSNTSHARVVLSGQNDLGVLAPGFLAIDLIVALHGDNPDLDLLDPDAGNSLVDWRNYGHPKRGNGLIVRDFEPSKRLLTVEAHGAYDSIFLAERMHEDDLQATASLIVKAVLAQDYFGGVFVNEKRVGSFPGALPMRLITRRGEREPLPDIVVVFATQHEDCSPAEECTSVVADTPLAEGEGIASPFSRHGTATFLAARGPDFRAGVTLRAPVSNADMGRTIVDLLHLDPDAGDFGNARVLREALAGGANRLPPEATNQTFTSGPSLERLVTELQLETLGHYAYFGSAVKSHQSDLVSNNDPPWWHLRLPRPKSFNITISN